MMKNTMKQNFVNTEDEFELDTITSQILKLKLNMVENSIELGVKLKQVKETLKHGEWIPFLEEKVNVSVRTAQKFIRIATEFANTKSLSHFETEKLYILLALTKMEREEFIEKNEIEKMSTRELTKKIKEINDNKRKNHKVAKESEIVEIEKIRSSIKYGIEEMGEIKHINHTKIKIDTEKIVKKVNDLIEEIKIRTGGFYSTIETNHNINCDARGGILAQLYAKGEITKNELVETIKAYNIVLDVNFKDLRDETVKENYRNNVNNTYRRYSSNTKTNYLAIIMEEMTYENVIEFAWEKNEKERLGLIEDARENTFTSDNITISTGFDEDIEMLCVFKDRETLAHYTINIDNILECSSKLFAFYNIDFRYLTLIQQYINKIEKDKLEKQKKYFDEMWSIAKFKSEIEKDFDVYTIIFYDHQVYKNKDELYLFKNIELIGEATLEDVLGGDQFEFELDNNKSLLKLLEKVDKQLWNKFKKIVLSQNYKLLIKRKDKEKKERAEQEKFRENNEYKFDATDIEVNKEIYRKLYNTLAQKYHPDKIGGDVEVMKVINGLKELWEI